MENENRLYWAAAGMRGAGIQTGKPEAERPLGVFVKQTVNTKCTEGCSHFVSVQNHELVVPFPPRNGLVFTKEPTAGTAMCHFDLRLRLRSWGTCTAVSSTLNAFIKWKRKFFSTQEHVCPVIQGLAMQHSTGPDSVSVLIIQLFCLEGLTHCEPVRCS